MEVSHRPVAVAPASGLWPLVDPEQIEVKGEHRRRLQSDVEEEFWDIDHSQGLHELVLELAEHEQQLQTILSDDESR